MAENKTAAVGSHSSVILFKAAGIHTVSAETVTDAEKAVNSLVKEGYEIIFVTENYMEKLENAFKRYRAKPYPVIIPVPDKSGPNGYGMSKIRTNMEKAIGTNIFDKDQK